MDAATLDSALRGRSLAKTMGGDLPEAGGVKRDWLVYHVCLALAAGKPAPCAGADAIAAKGGRYTGPVRSALSNRTNCEIAYQQTRVVAAWMRRDPRFMDACLDAAPHLGDFRDGAAVEALCAAWRDDAGGAHDAVLSALAAGLRVSPGREYLRGVVQELFPEPKTCTALGEDYLAVTCGELSDYRAAVAAGAGRCRGGICRVLAGAGPEACRDYTKSFMRAACAQGYASDFNAVQRRDFEELAAAAEKVLVGLDSAAGSKVELEQVGIRLDRLFALRARIDEASALYAPLSAPSAGASPDGKRSP